MLTAFMSPDLVIYISSLAGKGRYRVRVSLSSSITCPCFRPALYKAGALFYPMSEVGLGAVKLTRARPRDLRVELSGHNITCRNTGVNQRLSICTPVFASQSHWSLFPDHQTLPSSAVITSTNNFCGGKFIRGGEIVLPATQQYLRRNFSHWNNKCRCRSVFDLYLLSRLFLIV